MYVPSTTLELHPGAIISRETLVLGLLNYYCRMFFVVVETCLRCWQCLYLPRYRQDGRRLARQAGHLPKVACPKGVGPPSYAWTACLPACAPASELGADFIATRVVLLSVAAVPDGHVAVHTPEPPRVNLFLVFTGCVPWYRRT